MRIYAYLCTNRILTNLANLANLANLTILKNLATNLIIIANFCAGGGILGNPLFAKEPTNWLFGVGFGFGQSTLGRIYANSANSLLGTTGFNRNAPRLYSSTIKDLGFAWEFLAGYKHFLNDFVGFRYYANVSGQQYKDDIFTAGKTQAGVYEYTANADLLINFYNSDFFTFGAFGGFGVGGAYFDSPAFKTYQSEWNSIESQYMSDLSRANVGKIYKHHLSATLSAGLRFSMFQKIRDIGKRVCSRRVGGRQTCRVPVTRLEHSIELNTKFSLMTYRATDSADIFGGYCGNNATWNGNTNIGGQYLCLYRDKPGYEVKNPYKLTLRYIFAF